jgi:hypothetical protein
LQVQTPWNQADAPLLLESFPKRPRTQSEASRFGGSHKYKRSKTNKQPSFKDRLLWPVPLAQVLPRPQLIFPSKTWFFGNYLNFQQQKSIKNQYLSHSFKPYQINSIKSCSSRSLQQH